MSSKSLLSSVKVRKGLVNVSESSKGELINRKFEKLTDNFDTDKETQRTFSNSFEFSRSPTEAIFSLVTKQEHRLGKPRNR